MHGCICRRPRWTGLTAGAEQLLFEFGHACAGAPSRPALEGFFIRIGPSQEALNRRAAGRNGA